MAWRARFYDGESAQVHEGVGRTPAGVWAEKVAEAGAPAKIPALDALAQISPSDLKSADLKKPEPKAPPKRRVVKRTVRQPMVAFAQAPPRFDFDFFAHN